MKENDHKIKVLIVAAGPPLVGGQSVQAETLVSRLPESGQIETGFQPINPVFLSGLQKIKFVKTLVTLVGLIFSLLAKVPKYDIIHVFSASYFSFLIGPLPAILIGRLFGKKILLNYHSGFLREHIEQWPWSTKLFFGECDQIVVPSGYLVEIFDDFGFRSDVVSNSVDLSLFTYRKRTTITPTFLSNRNFEDLYNVECILRAFKLIKSRHKTASLVVAGSGPEESRLRQLVKDEEIDSVSFVGRVGQSEMAKLYDQNDIYLNTPNADNMPISILEAFATGSIVVSTNVGGIPYIVTDRETGLLVDENEEVAVANAVDQLLADESLGQTMSQRASEDVRKYLWESIGSNWTQVYQKLLNKH